MNNFKLAKQDNVVQGSHSEVGLPVRIAYKNWSRRRVLLQTSGKLRSLQVTELSEIVVLSH